MLNRHLTNSDKYLTTTYIIIPYLTDRLQMLLILTNF